MPAMTDSGLKPYMRPVPEPAAGGVAELVVPTGDGTAIHLISAGQARGMLRRLSEGLADCVKGEGEMGEKSETFWTRWAPIVPLAALSVMGIVALAGQLFAPTAPRTACASEGTVRTETLQTVQGAMVHQVVERPVCFDREEAR